MPERVMLAVVIWLQLGLISTTAWDQVIQKKCNDHLGGPGVMIGSILFWPIFAYGAFTDDTAACAAKPK